MKAYRSLRGEIMIRLSLIMLMLWGLLGCASPVNRSQIVDQETNVATVMQRGDAAYKRQDYATALHEWQFLARQGNPVAQYKLGGIYAQGLGVVTTWKVIREIWGAQKVLFFEINRLWKRP